MARPNSPSLSISRCGSAGGDADRTVLWVRGEHDIATRDSLAVAVARAAQREDVPVLIDLSGATFIDASTVGAIVGSRNRLRSRGQALELRAPSPLALRVLQLCGLAHLVHSPAVEGVHPVGVAAALSTRVDIPSTATNHDMGLDADGTAPLYERQPAEVRWSNAAAEMGRGRP